MTVAELKGEIVSKKMRSLYVFTGPEIAVQNIYIQQIAKAKQLKVIRADSTLEILSQLKNTSFLNTSAVYVIRDDSEFVSDEKLQSAVKQFVGSSIVIYLITNIDKRSKFYKQHKDELIEFEPLSPVILHKYIKKILPLTDTNCNKLIEVCDHDYSRILLELDKIRVIGPVKFPEVGATFGFDANATFEMLLRDGTIYQPAKDAAFDLIDAVITRSPKAFQLYDSCVKCGTSTLAIISLLYNNFKQMLQVQSYQGKDVSNVTGLTAWQIKCAKERMGHYTIMELVSAVKMIRRMEYEIKTGNMPEELAVPYLLVNLL